MDFPFEPGSVKIIVFPQDETKETSRMKKVFNSLREILKL